MEDFIKSRKGRIFIIAVIFVIGWLVVRYILNDGTSTQIMMVKPADNSEQHSLTTNTKAKNNFDLHYFLNEPSIKETGRITFPIRTNTNPPFNIACFDKDTIICGLLKSSGRWHVFDPLEYIVAHHVTSKNVNYFLDLGSNIGTLALYLAAKRNWKGVAVDPLYGPIIEFNQAANEFQSNFKVERAALTDVGSQIVKMSIDVGNPGGSHIKSTGAIEVKTITIDALVAKYERMGFLPKGVVFDYVKMDVEGFEYKSFIGAKNLMESKRFKIIQIEINPNLLRLAGDSEAALLKLLRSYGYDIYIGVDKTSPVTGEITGHELVDIFAFLRQ